MKYAIEPYSQLSVAMVQPLVGKCPIPDLVEILKRTGLQCGLHYPKNKFQYNKNSQSNAYQPHTTSSLASGSKPTFNNRGASNNSISVICRRCGGKGHYATQCTTNFSTKPGVQHLQECVSDSYNSDKDVEFHLGKELAE